MSTYTFTYTPDLSGSGKVTVEFDDTEHPFVGDVIAAFEQFLLGVTFARSSIEQYIALDKLAEDRTDMFRRVEELKADMAKREAKKS